MKHPTQTPANYDAEGSPGKREKREPHDAFKTSPLPVIDFTVLNDEDSLSEKNDVEAGDNPGEGTDMAEAQDAIMTLDEARAQTELDYDVAAVNRPVTTAILISKDDQETVEEMAEDTEADTANEAPILIVEDTVELAEVIQATLENMGMDALYATHGSTGLEQLKVLNPRLLIMDIGLPDITGWKMLDSVKQHYDGNEADMPPIIVITAYGDPANRLIGKLQNIHSYLLKPFTPDQVEKLVTMALAGEKPEDPFFSNESDSSS